MLAWAEPTVLPEKARNCTKTVCSPRPETLRKTEKERSLKRMCTPAAANRL